MNRASRRVALPVLLALVATGCAGVPARPGDGAPVAAVAADGADGALDASPAGAAQSSTSTALAVPPADAARSPAVTPLAAAPTGGSRLLPARALGAPGASRGSSARAAGDTGTRRERAAALDADRGAPPGEALTGARARVIEAARRMLGTSPRLDCSGFVLAALAEAGVTPDLRPARSRSESLYRAGRPLIRPSPGDLVFFDRTRDRDRRGRRAGRDRFTHVALVEAVDGTALTLIHRGGRRVERIRMDLSRPSDPAANDPIRVRRRRDRPGTRYLSGELFAAFGGLLPDDVTRKLQARRGRDTPARHPATR